MCFQNKIGSTALKGAELKRDASHQGLRDTSDWFQVVLADTHILILRNFIPFHEFIIGLTSRLQTGVSLLQDPFSAGRMQDH